MKTYKLIEPWQGTYIQNSHLQQTAKEMSDHLKVDEIKVRIFCQAEGIAPKQSGKRRKPRYK